VAHYGHLLRVATRSGVDARDLAVSALTAANFVVRRAVARGSRSKTRFVSMVRAEQQGREQRSAS